MRQDQGSRWTAFTARQVISTRRSGFTWDARTGPGGVIHIRDALVEGVGRLSVKAFGLVPFARVAPDPELTRGELIRYLAELPWAPGAILGNPDLRWSAEPGGRLSVTAGPNDAARVSFTLDMDGRIAEAYCADRPRAVADGYRATPWRGRFSDYVRFGDVWIPASGAVSWLSDGVAIEVWRGRILDWHVLPSPYPRGSPAA